MNRIIVAIDGSANSTAAATFAAELAGSTNTPVVAVHAVGLLDQLRGEEHPVISQTHHEEIEEQFRTAWCVPLAGLSVDHQLRPGNPVSVLLQVADQPGDVIVMGSRGAGGFTGSSLGSTSTQVAHHSTVPVVIVPLPEQER